MDMESLGVSVRCLWCVLGVSEACFGVFVGGYLLIFVGVCSSSVVLEKKNKEKIPFDSA